jgi:hypothetical protein
MSLYQGYFAEELGLDPSGTCSFTFSDEFNELKFKSGRVQKINRPMTYSITVNWTCPDDYYPDPTSKVGVTFDKLGALDSVGLKIPFLSGYGINVGGGFEHNVIAESSLDVSTAKVNKVGGCMFGWMEMDIKVTWTHTAEIGIGPKIKSTTAFRYQVRIKGLQVELMVIFLRFR